MAVGSYGLVAEDHFDTIEVMREVLETEGHRVTSGHNGAAGYRALQSETPDFILSAS